MRVFWEALKVHFAKVHFLLLGSGGSRLAEWSLVAAFLEGFSVTSHERRLPGAPVKGIKSYQGYPPVLKVKVVMSKVVFSGLHSVA